MPGIVRKLIIFATTDGLVLQPHGGSDQSNPLRIDFKSRSIGPHVKVQPETFRQSPHLESHGIIGEHLPPLLHFARTLDTRDIPLSILLTSHHGQRTVDDCVILISALHNS